MLDAVVSMTFEQLEVVCAQACASAGTGADRIWAISRAYAAFATEHPAEYRILFERTGDAGPGQPPYPAGIRAFQYLLDAFEQLASETGSGHGDIARDAQALWASLHGIVTIVPATPAFPWKPADDLLAHIIDALTAGRGLSPR